MTTPRGLGEASPRCLGDGPYRSIEQDTRVADFVYRYRWHIGFVAAIAFGLGIVAVFA